MKRLILPPCAALALAGLAKCPPQPPLLINETPSVPPGLYVRSLRAAPMLGRLVTVAQPAAARAYLAGFGVPSDMRLLKRVEAVGGEPVCAKAGRLRTPRREVAAPRHDRLGAPLPVWDECRRLRADEVLLLGDTPTSFDSRYFGPVRLTELEGAYEEVLTW